MSLSPDHDLQEFSKVLGFAARPYSILQAKVAFICFHQDPVAKDFLQSTDWGQLLAKMIHAMGLNLAEVEILILAPQDQSSLEKTLKNLQSSILIFMGDAPELNLENKTSLHTHHPQACLKDPSLKKQVWTQLQKAIQRL